MVYISVYGFLISVAYVFLAHELEGSRLWSYPGRQVLDKKNTVNEMEGNSCKVSEPWPCKTAGQCLSFDFICDGTKDCLDGFDEDHSLCTAKNRPPLEILKQYIDNNREWLVPEFLGEGSSNKIAVLLIESPTIVEYAEKMKLTSEQKQKLNELFTAIKENRQVELLLMGMPASAWTETDALLLRIAQSGFTKE